MNEQTTNNSQRINTPITTPSKPSESGLGATILDKIIASKRQEIVIRKTDKTISDLEKENLFNRKCISLKENLLHSESGIIAEFKRKSPSKGWIFENADALEIPKGYCDAGASGISILTDEPFFGGTVQDLISARALVTCPILRKEFIVDEYQLFESKAIGADVILLIAAALTTEEAKNLAKQAKALGLEVLLEIHNKQELSHINEHTDIVGVNNRNLKNFEVDIAVSNALVELIPNEFVKISESGISHPETVIELRKSGYRGFLMGENFMKTNNPSDTLKEFIVKVA